MEIKRYARRSNRGSRTLLKDSDKKKAEQVWDARKGEWRWGERKAEWCWGELDERSEERSGDVLSLSVPDVKDRYGKEIPYNYTINLSLDDLAEIIKALSRSIASGSRPALQEALGPHIGKLLAITLAASDYQNVYFPAVTIRQQEEDTLIDLGPLGAIRLENFSADALDVNSFFTVEDTAGVWGHIRARES